MKYFVLLSSIMLLGAATAWAQVDKPVYFVVPQEKGISAEQIAAMDIATVKIYPMLSSNAEKKVLFFANPMNGGYTSNKAMKDDMGMDYLAVIVDDSKKTVVFYVDPDKKTVSKEMGKNAAGLEYVPAYLMPISIKYPVRPDGRNRNKY